MQGFVKNACLVHISWKEVALMAGSYHTNLSDTLQKHDSQIDFLSKIACPVLRTLGRLHVVGFIHPWGKWVNFC